LLYLGVYKSEQFSDSHNEWIENKEVKMEITVEVKETCIRTNVNVIKIECHRNFLKATEL
jgi:hypothetical protein